MTEIIVKIMVELLSTLALVTRQIKQKRPSEYALVDIMWHATNLSMGSETGEEAVRREWGRVGITKVRSTNTR
jgi:hypothetical protein